MNIAIVVLLLLVGIVFLLTEIIFIPGFGIAGLFGFLSMGGAVYIAYVRVSPEIWWFGHATLACAVFLFFATIYWFFRKRIIEKFALDATIDSQISLASPGKKIERLQEDPSLQKDISKDDTEH